MDVETLKNTNNITAMAAVTCLASLVVGLHVLDYNLIELLIFNTVMLFVLGLISVGAEQRAQFSVSLALTGALLTPVYLGASYAVHFAIDTASVFNG